MGGTTLQIAGFAPSCGGSEP